MKLVIDLQDRDGKSYNRVQIGLQDQATVDQLKDDVHSTFNIEAKYQQIFHNDRRIDLEFGTLEETGIKHKDTLILKHSDVQWWPQYHDCVENAITSKDNRIENAKESARLHEQLMKSNLFHVYPSFNEFRMKRHHQAVAWLDGDLNMIGEAAKDHFLVQHGLKGGAPETGFEYRYEPRPKSMGGTRKGIVVYAKLHGEEYPTKYSVKCHHFGTTDNTPKGSFPDIREIFCYKLLELIKVGPAVQFILPNPLIGNRTSTYICTKWRDDFIPLSKLNEEDTSVEALVQLCLLRTVLCISDLHKLNCGQWEEEKTAAIVDFMPGINRIHKNIKNQLFNGEYLIGWKEPHYNLVMEFCEERRLEITKKWLQHWDLLKRIDEADKEIKREKDRMKERNIGFKDVNRMADDNTVTDDLDDYIYTVRENVKSLISVLQVDG